MHYLDLFQSGSGLAGEGILTKGVVHSLVDPPWSLDEWKDACNLMLQVTSRSLRSAPGGWGGGAAHFKFPNIENSNVNSNAIPDVSWPQKGSEQAKPQKAPENELWKGSWQMRIALSKFPDCILLLAHLQYQAEVTTQRTGRTFLS